MADEGRHVRSLRGDEAVDRPECHERFADLARWVVEGMSVEEARKVVEIEVAVGGRAPRERGRGREPRLTDRQVLVVPEVAPVGHEDIRSRRVPLPLGRRCGRSPACRRPVP